MQLSRMRRGLALAVTAASLCVGVQSATADVVDDRPAAATGGSQTYVAARASSGETMVKSWSSSTGQWSPWQGLGGFASSGPSVDIRPDGTTDFFVRGGDNALYHRFRRPDGSWADWGWLGGGLTAAPASVVRKGTNNVDVVVRSTSGSIVWREASSGWSDWADLGGWSQDAPAIVSTVDGGVDIFIRGSDNQIYAKSLRNNNWSTWSSWAAIGGGACSAPTAESPANGAVDVFYTACDGSVYQRSWGAGGWSNWVRHEADATSGPAAIANGNAVTLYVRGGSRIYYNQWNGTNAWTGWTDFGSPDAPGEAPALSPPVATSADRARVANAFAQGDDAVNALVDAAPGMPGVATALLERTEDDDASLLSGTSPATPRANGQTCFPAPAPARSGRFIRLPLSKKKRYLAYAQIQSAGWCSKGDEIVGDGGAQDQSKGTTLYCIANRNVFDNRISNRERRIGVDIQVGWPTGKGCIPYPSTKDLKTRQKLFADGAYSNFNE